MINQFSYEAPGDQRFLRIVAMVLGIIILLLTFVSANNSTTNSTSSSGVSISLPTMPQNDITNSLGSIWNEYITWSVSGMKQTLSELKSDYGLTGIYDTPFLGPIITCLWLLLAGHVGALFFVIQGTFLFTFIGMLLFRAILGKPIRSMLAAIPILNWRVLSEAATDVILGFMAAFLAIAIISLF